MAIQNVSVFALLLTTLACASVTAEEKPDDTVSEKLQGRWLVVSGVNQGRELSKQEVEGVYVTVAINSITTYDRNQQQRFRAVFRTDGSQDPIHITMTPLAKNASNVSSAEFAPDEKETAPAAAGILKFLGNDKWMLCYGLPGAERPTTFESPKGSKNMLFTLERDQGDPVPSVLNTKSTNEN